MFANIRGSYKIKRKVLAMTKSYKVDSPAKKNRNIKGKAFGLWNLAVALAELAAVYTFATQQNQILWVVAGFIGIDAAVRFGSAFLKD